MIKWLHCNLSLFCLLALMSMHTFGKQVNKVIIYPAPTGERLNNSYRVTVSGKNLPVYNAQIGAQDDTRRFKAVDDLLNSNQYFDIAGFAYFDLQGIATVNITIDKDISSVKILPASALIQAVKSKNVVSFRVIKPQNLTIEINGEYVKSLHLFINPIDENRPKPGDPNVIFFGPGIHEVTNMIIGDNKTVYVAGGAIVRAGIGKNEQYGVEPSGLKNYNPRFILAGKHIRFRGHGIIDASACPVHSANFVMLKGQDITVEDVIIRNSPTWNIPIRQSDRILIKNVKILGYRANTDGIDICNSTNVIVDGCFIRSNDDLIVVKTEEGEGLARHIIVKNCVLWNQLAHPLSLGSELRENVDDILFTNCDIIHDTGREWSLRVFQCDASTISNVRFEDIRIEESHLLISCWIGKNVSSFNKGLGSITGITFKNISATGAPLTMDLSGGDVKHHVQNVRFQHVIINGKIVTDQDIRHDQFAEKIIVLP